MTSCVYVLGLLLALALSAQAKVSELSSSIIIIGQNDYAMQGNRSRCTDMVDKAANFTNSRLNFVPTLYWVNQHTNNNRQTFPAAASPSTAHYCVNRTVHSDNTISCPSITQQDIHDFTYSMHRCLARAAAYNLSIAITPQIDDGTASNSWRNTLQFDPLLPYQQHSYMDVMLQPLAVAVKGVISNKTKLWFSLEGSAGASLFHHPRSYLEAMAVLKEWLSASMPHVPRSNMKFGITSNFNKLCGCTLLNISEPNDFLSEFPKAFAGIRRNLDKRNIHRLFTSVDFIGVNVAVGLRPGFPPGDLQYAMNYFSEELSFFGVNMSQMLQQSNVELHWHEVGVGGGGGLGLKPGVPARDATQAAKFPFVGIVGPYRQRTDPWMLYDIESFHSPVRDYAALFYQQVVEYLWKQHEFKWPVDAAFVKNIGSWDVQAIHPESFSAEGSYMHASVLASLNLHNIRVQRLLHLTETLGEACVKFLLESRQPDFGQRISAISDVVELYHTNATWR